MLKRSVFIQINILILLLFISCEDNKTDAETNYKAGPKVLVLADKNELSGISNIKLSINNFPKIWKLYLTVINFPLLDIDKKILLDTTSAQDKSIYFIPWNTTIYPNGNYQLYAEITDSSNNRITNTNSFYIINYSIIEIENKLEVASIYNIGSLEGTVFSNSVSQINTENYFDNISISFKSAIPICGEQLLFYYTLSPESENNKILIKPNNEYFFLKINNNSNKPKYINSIIIKNGSNEKICENLSIPSNGQIYSIGYFPFNFENYRSGNISVVSLMSNYSDTSVVSLYNERTLIDTIIIQ